MDSFVDSLGTGLDSAASFLPTLIVALVVLIVGWIIAALLARLTRAILKRVGFDALIERGRVKETLALQESRFDPSRIIGTIVFWVVLVTTFLATANILGLTALSVLLTRLIVFLPVLAIAVIVLVIAVALAQIAYEAIIALLGDRNDSATAIASIAKWGIIVAGVFIALSHLRIAPVIINGLFLALVGGLAIAFAISFGLGNIDLAKEITGNWYHRGQDIERKSQEK